MRFVVIFDRNCVNTRVKKSEFLKQGVVKREVPVPPHSKMIILRFRDLRFSLLRFHSQSKHIPPSPL